MRCWSFVGWQICDSAHSSHVAVPLTAKHLGLQSYKSWKTLCYSPFKCQKTHARVSLKAKNATEVKIRMGQNVTPMGWTKLQWIKMPHSDQPSIFWGGWASIHFGSECYSRTLSQGQSITVVNCPSEQKILWMFCGGQNVAWSGCGWT
jgi:hypothetical protein